MNYTMKAQTSNLSTTIFRNIFVVLSILFSTSLFAQASEDSNKGVFDFETETLDYGTIAHKSDGVRAFKFKNTGNAPIVITKVKGSCGCTVPTKPKGPIMPGETAEIGVKYATDRVGAFTKTITVTSNASEATKVIKIKGKVLAGEGKSVLSKTH